MYGGNIFLNQWTVMEQRSDEYKMGYAVLLVK